MQAPSGSGHSLAQHKPSQLPVGTSAPLLSTKTPGRLHASAGLLPAQQPTVQPAASQLLVVPPSQAPVIALHAPPVRSLVFSSAHIGSAQHPPAWQAGLQAASAAAGCRPHERRADVQGLRDRAIQAERLISAAAGVWGLGRMQRQAGAASKRTGGSVALTLLRRCC